MQSEIVIKGAREHNLKGVNLVLPRDALIVFTGVSGSGKSSLAFDTLYAEGQRRYVESLSSYARQFLGALPKPDVDFISGLSPSISIEQKGTGHNPRSTVGTITEIYDFLRVLYARTGDGYCPDCGQPISAQTREQILERILALPPGTRFMILAPVVRGQKGEYRDLFDDMLKAGYVRARVDGQVVSLRDDLRLDRQIRHDIEIVVDRLTLGSNIRPRLADSVEQALLLGKGTLMVALEQAETGRGQTEQVVGAERAPAGRAARARRGRQENAADQMRREAAAAPAPAALLLSAHYACTQCGTSYELPSPQLFSFNSPQGMCPDCDGLGTRYTIDPDLIVPDGTRSFAQGAVRCVFHRCETGTMRDIGRWRRHIFEGVARALGFDLTAPWRALKPSERNALLYGTAARHIPFEWRYRGGVWKHGGKFEGIIPELMAKYRKSSSGIYRRMIEKYMRIVRCARCEGTRLNPQARAVRVGGRTITEVCAMSIDEVASFFDVLGGTRPAPAAAGLAPLDPPRRAIASEVLKELRGRVAFLRNVGLDYLTLDRAAPTLSGGESQRIRLASQVGCGLVGVLYILDEPSIGLHHRDNDRLLATLKALRDMGNTVVVVEHDEATIRSADWVVDFGPGPGVRGGEVVAAGTLCDLVATPASLTGQYLSGARCIRVPERRRPPGRQKLRVLGAAHNNLRGIDVDIPLGLFVGVTGVSGSGKSSLINDILKEALYRDLNGGTGRPGRHKRILGTQHLDKVIDIDQSPIGRTPRSNPGTYVKVFDEIRAFYAQLPDARKRGYAPGRFSFNVAGGRCEACEGNGSNRLEMDFLADVWVPCPVCSGHRFKHETLEVRFKGKSIADVLEMDVQEALAHFENVPKIAGMLRTLHDVGLDYIKIGQPSPSLSGGEAQRIKLARELVKRSTGRTLYILDEPTTGLHFEDIRKLLEVLHSFVEANNTVVVIEHNLDVIKTADWVIDLGPEGGAGGGRLVATGTPEQLAECAASHTGRALGDVLSRPGSSTAPARPRRAGRGGAVSAASPDRAASRIAAITVRGARQHNLKGIDVEIPRDRMTVFCGPSGSGKTSLAMDTIYAEGQRRYVESLSAYARQFLAPVEKPRVEHIAGLSPAIAIEQKATSRSPRSTVGTVTEIYDYLRILMARLGTPHCPDCELPIGTQTTDEIIQKVLARPAGSRVYVMAPVERREPQSYAELWQELKRSGYARARVDGRTVDLDRVPAVDHRRKHTVEVIVDRVVIAGGERGGNSGRSRIADSVEAALSLGRGVLHVAHADAAIDETRWRVERFSQHFACDRCGRSFEELSPHNFSFNSPLGWCAACEGIGTQQGSSLAVLVPQPRLSLRRGAIALWPADCFGAPGGTATGDAAMPLIGRVIRALAEHCGFALDTPFEKLEPKHQRAILHGIGEAWIAMPAAADCPAFSFQHKGLFPAIEEASRLSAAYRQRLELLTAEVPCMTCLGSRLRGDAAAVRFHGKTIAEIAALPLAECQRFFETIRLAARERGIAADLLRELQSRLRFLVDVGLDYLTLARPSATLSGGESQRIRLASQIGSGLTGVLYVLDEPTIGLHPRDNRRLLAALERLRDLGNTLLVVEHDREVVESANYLLDFGPAAGEHGGTIVAEGPPDRVRGDASSLTGGYLSGRQAIPVPTNRRVAPSEAYAGAAQPTRRGRAWLEIVGARQNNLKDLTVRLPLGAFVSVTGVSGSGKSSLVHDILWAALARRLHRASTTPGAHDLIRGLEHINKVINVDQDPIGNTPTSNPATYSGVFDLIRQLFAQLPESRVRGYQPRRFSFNKPGGRCEACEGAGQRSIEMHFLPDVWVECETCKGKRYNPETLAVRYKGHSIADVLEMSVDRALELFCNIPAIRTVLETLRDVGLGYIRLGQASPTLSGGEAQRVKLAAELARPGTGRTLYILDEPTTGLHFDDVRRLLDVLNRLVDLGNTVLVVEHNMDVIKTADWIIDLGPEAGDAGGTIVAEGPPEMVAGLACDGVRAGAAAAPNAAPLASHTGRILREVLARGPHVERPRDAKRAVPVSDRVELDRVEVQAAMPWESDGRRWHTVDRTSSDGKPCRWQGGIVAAVADQIQRLGAFGPTDWNSRTLVEIAARRKTHGWFFHASTGEEWLVRLKFRCRRGTFKADELARSLALKPLDDIPELPIYGRNDRVTLRNGPGPWQESVLAVHWIQEIDTPAFWNFLERAVRSFQETAERLGRKPAELMPWKVLKEKWHFARKGFPAGRPARWDHAILDRLVGLLRGATPDVVFDWEGQHAVGLRAPGITRAWGWLNTKSPDALTLDLACPKGQYNLAQLDRVGPVVEIRSTAKSADCVQLGFRRAEDVRSQELAAFLRGSYQAFRSGFGRKTA